MNKNLETFVVIEIRKLIVGLAVSIFMILLLSVNSYGAPVVSSFNDEKEFSDAELEQAQKQKPQKEKSQVITPALGDDLNVGSRDPQNNGFAEFNKKSGWGTISDTDKGTGFGNPEVTKTKPKPTQKPSAKSDFSFGSSEIYKSGGRLRGRHYPVVRHKGNRWNGCDMSSAVTGGFGSNNRKKCAHNKRTVLKTDFAKHLNQKFMPCIRQAAKAARFPVPKKVHINLGSLRDNRPRNGTRSTKLSQHAYGRALDIFAFNLYDENGRRTYVRAHQSSYGGQNKLFYNRFVLCWKKSVRKKCGGGVGAIVHRKAKNSLRRTIMFYANNAHKDHIHMEFPNNCRGK